MRLCFRVELYHWINCCVIGHPEADYLDDICPYAGDECVRYIEPTTKTIKTEAPTQPPTPEPEPTTAKPNPTTKKELYSECIHSFNLFYTLYVPVVVMSP